MSEGSDFQQTALSKDKIAAPRSNPFNNTISPAQIVQNTNFSDIFPFEFKANESLFLLSNAAVNEQKAITAMYTKAEVEKKPIQLILDSKSAKSIITYQLIQQLQKTVNRPVQIVIVTTDDIKKTPSAIQLKYFDNNGQEIKPEKAHKIDAKYDLRYPGKNTLVFQPKILTKINLRIAFEIPPEAIIQIAFQSSLASKKINVREEGVIDARYIGDITVMLQNKTKKPFKIEHAEKIAQAIYLLLINILDLQLVKNKEQLRKNERGTQVFGAILSQLDKNGQKQVIAYASRTLKPTKLKYGSTELKATTIIWAIKHFQQYLKNRKKFDIIIDNIGLK
ncbi:hypothetical protein G9A89_007307 [Geosiphon pyriformis]|nr:hypothetical protein G9A89_007307 [Geosiphon pyriformis]